MRKLLGLLAIAARVVLAGACGSSEDGSSSAKTPAGDGPPARAGERTAVETVQVAYKDTAAEGTARTSFEVTAGPLAAPEDSGWPGPQTMTGQGVGGFFGVRSRITGNINRMGGLELRQTEGTGSVKMQ